MGCGTSVATATQGKDEKTGRYCDGPFCHFQTGLAFAFDHLMGGALVIQMWHPGSNINRVFPTCIIICDPKFDGN